MNEPVELYRRPSVSEQSVSIEERVALSMRALTASLLGLVALILLVFCVTYKLQSWRVTDEAGKGQRSVNAAARIERIQTPRLEVDQRKQRNLYEAEQRQLLFSYGWVDRGARIARIPIERAMQLIMQGETESQEDP